MAQDTVRTSPADVRKDSATRVAPEQPSPQSNVGAKPVNDSVSHASNVAPAQPQPAPQPPVSPSGPAQWVNKPATDTIKDTAKKQPVIKYYPTTGYVAINNGYGFPENQFAAEACANTGSYSSVSIGLPVPKKRLGIAAELISGSNSVNTKALLKHYYNQMADQNLHYNMMNNPARYTYKAMEAGLFWTFPFSKFNLQNKLSVDARVMLGCMFATVPETEVSVHDSMWGIPNVASINSYAASGASLTFNIGFSVRYLVTPHVAVMLTADYFTSNPKFQLLSNTISESGGWLVQNEATLQDSNQQFKLFNLGIGIGWAF